MGNSKIKLIKSVLENLLSSPRYGLSYIVEDADWAVKEIGDSIIDNLNAKRLLRARTTITSRGLRNQIVHFGSANTFLSNKRIRKVHKSNKTVLTWFHYIPGDEKNEKAKEAVGYLDFVHTSCEITKTNLVDLGFEEKKIAVIPIGVDLAMFKPIYDVNKKNELRDKYGIPNDKIVIGSFQKDGNGWGEGLEPKLIKGPDIFVEVVEKLSKKYPVFVFLVGPARGYVKKALMKAGIPYRHIYFEKLSDVAECYWVLDLYLVTSRLEGGPKQILEAMASGVPLVSTKVGMVPDIIEHNNQALLAESGNVEQLVKSAGMIIENADLRMKLIKNGIETSMKYSWSNITERYYDEIYSKL
jgi:glycosyltransferase involved in cell wall biosynthesis